MKYINRAVEDIVFRADKTLKGILITGARQTKHVTSPVRQNHLVNFVHSMVSVVK